MYGIRQVLFFFAGPAFQQGKGNKRHGIRGLGAKVKFFIIINDYF
jgi:hypothetical protein